MAENPAGAYFDPSTKEKLRKAVGKLSTPLKKLAERFERVYGSDKNKLVAFDLPSGRNVAIYDDEPFAYVHEPCGKTNVIPRKEVVQLVEACAQKYPSSPLPQEALMTLKSNFPSLFPLTERYSSLAVPYKVAKKTVQVSKKLPSYAKAIPMYAKALTSAFKSRFTPIIEKFKVTPSGKEKVRIETPRGEETIKVTPSGEETEKIVTPTGEETIKVTPSGKEKEKIVTPTEKKKIEVTPSGKEKEKIVTPAGEEKIKVTPSGKEKVTIKPYTAENLLIRLPNRQLLIIPLGQIKRLPKITLPEILKRITIIPRYPGVAVRGVPITSEETIVVPISPTQGLKLPIRELKRLAEEGLPPATIKEPIEIVELPPQTEETIPTPVHRIPEQVPTPPRPKVEIVEKEEVTPQVTKQIGRGFRLPPFVRPPVIQEEIVETIPQPQRSFIQKRFGGAINKRYSATKRVYAPVTESERKVDRVVVTKNMNERKLDTDTVVNTYEKNEYTPQATIPLILKPPFPQGTFYNYSPESEIVIAPVARLTLKSQPSQPLIKTTQQVITYLQSLFEDYNYGG